MRYYLPLFLLMSGIAIVGCTQQSSTESSSSSENSATAQTINEHCPIMGSDVTPEGGTVEWNGQTVGFCCDGCSDKWLALSEDEKKEALANAEKAHADHIHSDHAS